MLLLGVFFSQGDNLVVFDGRTMRCLATLSTSKKVLLQLHYNLARDEIISGGSDGCFVWRLTATPFKPYAQGKAVLLNRVPDGQRLLNFFDKYIRHACSWVYASLVLRENNDYRSLNTPPNVVPWT